jgi:6-phosphogluconolactonase (cycloisomerase 2 family)
MHDHHLDRRDFLAGLAGLTAAVAARSTSRAQTVPAATVPRFMYVGSFTSDGRGHGEGISVFERKANRWSLTQVVKELADPSFIIVDRSKRHLYSAHGDGTEAVAYSIDDTTGRISVMNRQPTRGRNGVRYAANQNSDTVVIFRIDKGSGTLSPTGEIVKVASPSTIAFV